MNKKGFTLIELLVSISLVSLVAYFLFQIIFVIRDIYAEKTLKSELYIETSNVTNIINKDITTKLNDDIKLINANKVSDDILDIVYSDGSIMEVKIDRLSNKISYGTYSVDILKEAKIGSIKLYYNYDVNDLEKNGVFYVKIPVSLEKYNQDFSIYIYSRYDSSYALIGGELTNLPVNTCEYENGHTWTFDYTGDVQNFNVPCDGTYKIEAWGAQGGDANTTYIGGKGGYASGNITLEKEETLYVVVGGAGSSFQGAGPTSGSGGYNGGGSGKVYNSDSSRKAASGGGATHIAKVTGTLASIEYTSFVTQGNGYIVAGGGGGGHYTNSNNCGVGGNAGGLTGLIPTQYGTENTGSRISVGGKQNESSCATGNKSCSSFGQGGSPYSGEYNGAGSGGGGGLYGGSSANGSAGAGGSSYIGGVINGTTIAGNAAMPTHDGASTMTGNTGNGYAKITFIGSTGSNIEEVYNDIELIKNGVRKVDFTLNKYYGTDSSTKITDQSGYIQYSSTPAYSISNYVANNAIDITHYTTLKFKTSVDSNNTAASVAFVSKNKNVNHYTCNGDANKVCDDGTGATYNIPATLGEYTIDISSLSGEYYIGVASSNRTMKIYDMYLSN